MLLCFTTPAATAFSHLISAAPADSAYDAAKQKGCPAAAFCEPYSVLSIHISIHITPSSKYYKAFGYPGEELAPSAAAHGTAGLQIHFDQHIGSTVALWFVYPDIQRFAPSVILRRSGRSVFCSDPLDDPVCDLLIAEHLDPESAAPAHFRSWKYSLRSCRIRRYKSFAECRWPSLFF